MVLWLYLLDTCVNSPRPYATAVRKLEQPRQAWPHQGMAEVGTCKWSFLVFCLTFGTIWGTDAEGTVLDVGTALDY